MNTSDCLGRSGGKDTVVVVLRAVVREILSTEVVWDADDSIGPSSS
jgi:hypothetical protein